MAHRRRAEWVPLGLQERFGRAVTHASVIDGHVAATILVVALDRHRALHGWGL
jgi:hypothetical protein